MALLLRVIVSANEARRVKLTKELHSVDALIDFLRERLQLQGDFSLQFEDSDFDNALCDLSDIGELPEGRAVLHVKWKVPVTVSEWSDTQSLGSISSLDTGSLGSPGRPSSGASPGCSPSLSTNPSPSHSPSTSANMRNVSVWPSPFPIPPLSHDIELRLKKANEEYAKNKKGISEVPRDMSIDILNKITQASFSIKAYPEPHEVESIAVALISKYPCLKEDEGNGYGGWLFSIKNKFNNYRAKLRNAGCTEVLLNSKRKTDEEATQFVLKRPKRGEINHCPDHPNDQDEASLEEQRLLLVEASKKARLDESLIKEKMNLTFSLRRKEVVDKQPMVQDLKDRWPTLFFKDQIGEEFFRITNKDLLGTFRGAVEKYAPLLLRLYRAQKKEFGKDLNEILRRLDDETTNIVRHRKEAAIKGLPVFLREDHNQLFKQCLETDSDDVSVKGVTVGILYVLEDCVAEASSPKIQNIAVILEESIVVEDLPDTTTALAYLLGLLYALNISYPKHLKYTFETLQKVFMDIDPKCSNRVRSLKKKLDLA